MGATLWLQALRNLTGTKMAAPKKAVGPKSDKEWRDAIRMAVHEVRGAGKSKVKALRMLANTLVDKALDGDVSALKEIGDRLDGKPAQSMAVTGENGGPLVVEIVKFGE